jgi:hypothetical protein
MAQALTFRLESAGPFDPDAQDLQTARATWKAFRAERGFGVADLLGDPDSNLKLGKDAVPTYGLSLSPADASGEELCVWRSPGCTAACVLSTSFRGKLDSVATARAVKSQFLATDPQAFVTILGAEIRRAVAKNGRILVRLNVASDIRWEYVAPSLFDIPGASFYDYTKAPRKHRGTHPNYRLTFSVSERDRSVTEALEYLQTGGTAAVVFDIRKGNPLPATWNGFGIIDGDVTDARTFDPDGVVVGLRSKADGRNDETGFVKPGVSS